MTFNVKPQPLRWPITTTAGATLDAVPLRPILHGEHADLVAKFTDEDEQFFELLKLASGLDGETLDRLKRPDWISLVDRICDLVAVTSARYLGPPEDPFEVPLLLPVESFGKVLETLRLEVPALKASKAMARLGSARERAEFITAHCTGLALEDLARLSVPDWNTLQECLNDFLNKPAASFPRATSTS